MNREKRKNEKVRNKEKFIRYDRRTVEVGENFEKALGVFIKISNTTQNESKTRNNRRIRRGRKDRKE